jgi:hypothetical protein
MPGASPETRRVKALNANWRSDVDAPDGRFEVMIVTDDDEQYFVPTSPASMATLVALSQADSVLAWDPTNRTLIAANLVGTMPWTRQT